MAYFQLAQKLVANEKVVKMRRLSKQSIYENALITLQIKFCQKGGGGQCPLWLRQCGLRSVYAVNMQSCCLKMAKKFMHFSCERFASQISGEETTHKAY